MKNDKTNGNDLELLGAITGGLLTLVGACGVAPVGSTPDDPVSAAGAALLPPFHLPTEAVCGRGSGGITCATSNGVSFGAASVWQSSFSDANGWYAAQYYSTIQFANVGGSGKADVCGRGVYGINCAISDGRSFGPESLWEASFSDANGWNLPQYYSTIRLTDLDGDGKADVCGRGIYGLNCGLSNGTSFGPVSLWSTAFSDRRRWASVEYYSTIQFADLNADGKADVCGREAHGISCALSNGTSFGPTSFWSGYFIDAAGWNVPEYYSTIRLADVNGDFKADICGRGVDGIWCALSNGANFGPLSLWSTDFKDADGWNAAPYYSTIQLADVNGDGMADICGRGVYGINCALSSGTSFGTAAVWQASFSDANQWNLPQYYSTIRLTDVDNDGVADVCGRGIAGINCALSNGSSFNAVTLTQPDFSDAKGWAQPQFYTTIRYPLE